MVLPEAPGGLFLCGSFTAAGRGISFLFAGPGAGFTRPGPALRSDCLMHLRGREHGLPAPASFCSPIASCICGAGGRIYPSRPRYSAGLLYASAGPGAGFTRPGPASQSACSLTLSQPVCFLFFMSKVSWIAFHPEVAASLLSLFSCQKLAGPRPTPKSQASSL